MNDDFYQEDENVPKPTPLFVGDILSSWTLLFVTIVCFFIGDVNNYPAIIIGIITLIPGLYFLFRVFHQIVLRIRWYRKRKRYSKGFEPVENTYDIDKYMQKKYGKNYIPNVDAALVRDKYGNTYTKKTILNSDLGLLVGCLMFLVVLWLCVVEAVESIGNKDVLNIVLFISMGIISTILEICFIRSFITEITRRKYVKRLVKEGIITKEPMGINTLLHRILISLFTIIMVFMTVAIAFQESGKPLPKTLIRTVLYFTIIPYLVIGIVYWIYTRFSTIKRIINFFRK